MAVRSESRILFGLAWPVVMAQLATVAMGIVDTLMVARLGTDGLAAASLGHAWVFASLVLGIGLLMGLDPIVSQAHGAGDGDRAGLALQRGLVLAVATSLPIALAWTFTRPILESVGQSPELAAAAHSYALVQVPSIPLILMFTALRHYLGGRTIVAPAMWVGWAANVINVIGNWALIFGHLGFEPRGLVGAGIATAISRAFLFVGLVAVVRVGGLHRDAWRPWSRAALSLRGLGEVAAFGLPVAIQVGLEVWCFHLVTLFAGLIDAASIAAHTIVLRVVSFAFMIPFGLSIAAAIRVGNLIGAGDRTHAQRSARVAMAMAAAVMAPLAVGCWVGRQALPLLWSPSPDVLAAAEAAMPIAAFLMLFDGVQVVASGILRGNGDARPAAVANLLGYYALALPIGAWLAFARDQGLSGLWWGLAIGLAAISILMAAWVEWRGPARSSTAAVADS